jgi:hypothetical protein
MNVDPAKLKLLVGKYRLNPQVAVNIFIENDHMVLLAPDGSKISLYGASENEFYVKGMYLRVKFLRDSAGKVTGAHVEQFQGGFDLAKEN